MPASIDIQAFQGQLLKVLWRIARICEIACESVQCKPGIDVVLQRHILATSHGQMGQSISSKMQHRLCQYLTAHCGIVEFETGETGAEGIHDVDQKLIQSVVARLSNSRTIILIRSGGIRLRLMQSEGQILPGCGICSNELAQVGGGMVQCEDGRGRALQ
jgi:hypothetical protein